MILRGCWVPRYTRWRKGSPSLSFRNGKFGRLTIRQEISPDIFQCDCQCGNELAVWKSLLADDIQRNCGMCIRRKSGRGSVHGHTRTVRTRDGRRLCRHSREYNSWSNMVARCQNEKHHAYFNYGGRGIRVCQRWMPEGTGRGFRNFLDDMGPRPSGLTLDRKDPQGHYEPLNCQWADPDTQARNKRRHLYPDGEPPVEIYGAMERRVESYQAALDQADDFGISPY